VPAVAKTGHDSGYDAVVEKDVDVPMRDGARLKADVLRPADAGKFPAILNLGPYQKDKLWIAPDTLEEAPNPLMNWETVNPHWWVPRASMAAAAENLPANANHGRLRNPSTSTMQSSGRQPSPGARETSGCAGSPITPSINGS